MSHIIIAIDLQTGSTISLSEGVPNVTVPENQIVPWDEFKNLTLQDILVVHARMTALSQTPFGFIHMNLKENLQRQMCATKKKVVAHLAKKLFTLLLS